MSEQAKRNEDMVAIHRMVVLIDEQAPAVEVDEHEEDTLESESTVDLAPFEIAWREEFEADAELTPWIVNEEHGV